jgi:DNA repair exonuclease SbcCD ATPase subunit
MTDRPEHDTSMIDLDAFHDWVDRVAEAEGTSPEAIVQQLMSTYWILNELTETLEETPYEHLLEQEPSEAAPPDGAREADEDGAEGTRSEIVDVIRAIAELNNAPEPARTERSIDPELVDVIEAIHRHSGTQQSAGPDPTVTHFTNQLERLRGEVSSLDGRLDDVEEETERELEDVAARVDDVDRATDELQTRLGSVEERHERELSDLDESVAYLEDAISERAHREALADLESRVDAKHEAAMDRVDSVDETFQAAYSDIKKILGHLLDSSTEHGVTLDVLVDAYESDVEKLRAAHEDAERLKQLQSAANRQGISTAVCDACGESFDVAMLAEPRCPHCQRDVDRFDSKSSLWRTKHIAKPRQHQSRESEATVRDRIREALDDADTGSGARNAGVGKSPVEDD